MRALGLVLLLLTSCHASSSAVTGAALSTAIGMAAAGASRASGGCYASCPTGTTCNNSTGLCQELPCRGQCTGNEVCDDSGKVPYCRPLRMPELQINGDKNRTIPL